MSIRLGVDIGGTFTDIVLFDESTKQLEIRKTPSTPDAFEAGVLTGIETALDQDGYAGDDVAFLSHGTTVGTNAVLEGELPQIGLITNAGLRDVIEIGDQTRPAMYDLFTDKPPSVIPRRLRKEVPGRLDYAGEEIEPLDEAAAVAVIDELAETGVESVVVSMLFSYLNDEHERRIGELIEERSPSLNYTLSSAVYPEIREYERTITTALNEAVKVTIRDYIGHLERGLADQAIGCPLNIMHVGGGVLRADQAVRDAIRTVLSGPAAGAVATRTLAKQEAQVNAIGMDMGGTSTDVSIVRDGEIIRTTEGEINNLPIKTPMIDLTTVGAGGGSITWVDQGGALRAGPISAGADPGPICYGRGGDRPTLTDANLILGRINPEHFISGELAVAIDRTYDRFEELIAEPLGKSPKEAAQSVVDVANARLTRELRRVTVERGEDPSEYMLVGFGGAGPLHAASVASSMDMRGVLIPPNPGVFSAYGLLVADVRVDASHSYRGEAIDVAVLTDQFAELVDRVETRFEEQGFDQDVVDLTREVDMRYRGQSYELTVPVPGGPHDSITEATVEDTARAFHERHQRVYGHAQPDEPVEVVILRVAGTVPAAIREAVESVSGTAAEVDTREVFFADRGGVDTTVYQRYGLESGEVIDGPAIVEEPSSTTLIPPEHRATVTSNGSLRID